MILFLVRRDSKMLIKEFAKIYNVSADTVRYYEKEQLLTPRRLENGFRFYDETCERNIIFILVFKQLGFRLQEIRELLQLETKPVSSACNQTTLDLFQGKIASLEDKVAFFTAATDTLKTVYHLMVDETYIQNKHKIELIINDMYENNIAKGGE